MDKRVFFASGKQKKFIKSLKNKSNLKWKELAEKLDISENTLSKSYQFELSSIPYVLFRRMVAIIGENENKVLNRYNGEIIKGELIIGRKVLGEKRKILSPIKITFTRTNLNLDISKINYSKSDLNKRIKFPTKLTEELAEEIGMHYGDGFLSAQKNDYRLKGNPLDEKDYYKDYIKPLFKQLYNLDVNLKEFDRSFGFEIYSKAFWEFKTKVIGIRPGEKYEITLPEVLKIRNKKILAAFLRGLFDTDGCLCFKTRYGYIKYYPTIELALTSKKLIAEVAEIIKMFGFNPNVYFNEKYGKIALNGISALKRYEKLIGWSSQKNLNKINTWRSTYPQLNMTVMA